MKNCTSAQAVESSSASWKETQRLKYFPDYYTLEGFNGEENHREREEVD